MQNPFTLNLNNYVVIWITGCLGMYIAEVTQENPLRLKVMERGPYANLKEEDFIFRVLQTVMVQRDEESCQEFLQECHRKGTAVMSGLKSLGITDNRLHYILPSVSQHTESV